MILPVGRDGDGSALVVFLASIRCSVWGHSDMFTSRRMSARPRSVRRPWQIGHTAGAISAAPQEGSQSRRNYKAGCWQGVFREHVRSLPNISGLTGDCGEGRADSLVAARPRRVVLLWCISGSRAIPGHCRAIHVPSSLLKAKGIERDWL